MGIEEVPWDLARNYLQIDDVVDMKEIARITNLSYWYVRALSCEAEKARPPFPPPYTRRGRKSFWLRKDIQEWINTREQARIARHARRQERKAASDDASKVSEQ